MDKGQVLSIQILGGFSVYRGDKALPGLERPSLQKVLVYLLVNRGQAVNRSNMAFIFWPDSNETQALANLRNLWFHLRRILPDLETFIKADRASLQWQNDAPFLCDAVVFEDAIDHSQSASFHFAKLDLLDKAVKAYRGELLPGHYEDWLLSERKRLGQLYGQALSELAALLEANRQYPQAIRYARALIQHDPLHEPAYAHLMRLQASMDDRAAALHTYHTCASLLEREIGVEPGVRVKELYQRLLKAEMREETQASVEVMVPLVGRDKSWENLQQAWRKARRGPQMVLIQGEAGIGKTHLAEAFVDWVRRQGITVLWARCYPTEEKLAYAPVVSWLRACPLDSLDRNWLGELTRLLPEIQADHPDLEPPKPMTKEWQRLRLFESLAKAVLTGQKALLLFIDDLQWCDRETLDWIAYLLTAVDPFERQYQLLVVGALRTEDRDSVFHMAKWQAQLIRAERLVVHELGPLNEADTLALAKHIYGQPIDPSRSRDIFQATEGHPFFIVELVRSARLLSVEQVEAIVSVSVSMPDRVRQVLEARLAQLSPLAREVIEQASVIGRDFTFPVLAQVTHLSEDGLVRCLDECWQRRIIREQGESAYDFSHDKLRQVAYDSLSETRRRWLHKQIAETLEKIYVDELDRAVSVIAGHYEAAEVFDKAISYYQRAAAVANRVYAHEEELAALENGLRLLPELPEGPARQALTAQLQENLGDLKMVTAAHQPARRAYQLALSNSPASKNLDQARIVYKIGRIMECERVGFDEVFAQFEYAEALLGEPHDNRDSSWWEDWCEIQLGKQDCLYWWQHTDAFDQLIKQSKPLIEKYGSPKQQAYFNIKLMQYFFLRNRYISTDDSVAAARAAIAALPESADPDLEGNCRFALGFTLLWYGEYEEAERELCEAFRLYEKTGIVDMQVRVMAYQVVVHRLQGHINRVEELANRCLPLAQLAKMYDYIGVCQAGLAWAVLRQTDPLEALDLQKVEHLALKALEAWEKHRSPYPLKWMAWWPLIQIAIEKEQLSEAIDYARELFEPDQQALASAIEPALTAALAAWDAEKHNDAHDWLIKALEAARKLNFA